MLRAGCFIFLLGFYAVFAAPVQVSLKGIVKDDKGAVVAGAQVSLVKLSEKDTTDAKGEFAIEATGVAKPFSISIRNSSGVEAKGNNIQFSVSSDAKDGSIEIVSTNGRRVALIPLGKLNAGTHLQPLPSLSAGFYVMNINIDHSTTTLNLVNSGKMFHVSEAKISSRQNGAVSYVAAISVDTLVVTKSGFETAKVALETYTKSDISVTLKTQGPVECKLPELPAPSGLTTVNAKLPDPFKFYDGTKLTRKDQWACRRAEILAMAGKYLYGPMPKDPDEITGSVSGSSITATVKVGSKTKNLTFNTSGTGDALCIIAESGGITPSGTRKFTLTPSNYTGTIKDLYGMSDITGTIAAAWTANIICAVIDKNPTAGINPDKIMVTGCSGAGKIAMTTGAFCEGIDLTVIVESGGGGAASLRMAEWYRHGGGKFDCVDGGQQKPPQGIDNLEETGLGGPWMAQAANWVRNSPAKVKNLPFDQHCVLACIAPRAVCHVTNQHGKGEWCHLGGTCEALSAWAAEPVWNALGVPENFGFLMYTEGSAPMHCSNPSSATGLANEFFKKVFKGDTSAKTDVMAIKDADLQQPQADWKDMWVDWDMAPTLQ